ncbi:single-stranded-DNA-specific exonuclease RecJ [Celerinatantimonas sp. YJH-8]|uniref:single-stranded-DNA-specific exonuclease RecJ n=1 Tax=Celerinatantimonas sp. YJH-8 TaxID=3228714 RepID=UPI0038BFF076
MMTTIRLIRRNHADTSGFSDQIHPLIQQIYARRGIHSEQQLNRSVKALTSWEQLNGMSRAVELLLSYRLKTILIVGDFDCDGATSSALMLRGLRALGFHDVHFLVPNRFEYGYGLSPEIADLACEQGAELIVTVDNGISSIGGVEHAHQRGVPVIITDHHLPGAQLPAAEAIVNPNLTDCDFPSKSLAGVGVAFYLLLAIRAKMREQNLFSALNISMPNLADHLDLVALGTVADVVRLDQNNRILVYQGLARIRAGKCCVGIQALIEVSRRQQSSLVASDLGFALGPRLNAVGRLDDMSLGIECLLCDDLQQARRMASEMDGLNRERKSIEISMQQEAEASVAKLSLNEQQLPSALALFREDWHQGVVGLVASRIKEKYYRPVFAFAKADEQTLKGSGRSVAGVHMRDLLERIDTQNPGLIDKFGGHAMAAGLSLPQQNFTKFVEQLERVATEFVEPEHLNYQLFSDGELPSELMTLEFAELLQQAGPWGQGFEEPVFDGEFFLLGQKIVGENHLKMTLQSVGGNTVVDAIAFNIDRSLWPDFQCRQIHVAYKLEINEYRGQRSVQLLVEWLEKIPKAGQKA